MNLDGLLDGAEIAGNLLVEPSGDNMRQHFAFARGQVANLRLDRFQFGLKPADLASLASARRCASNKSVSLTGLVRKSIAPAFMARTLVGISPFPVMNMTGR